MSIPARLECFTGHYSSHCGTDLGARLSSKGETLGPDCGVVVHTEPGKILRRWRAP